MGCDVKVLLIEDDYDLAKTICEYIEMEDVLCHHALNGVTGLTYAEENRFDVILLDLNLPRIDGLTICKELRRRGDDTPILMITARDGMANKIDGFQAGTDDYLVKPFALEELLLRIFALAKRRSSQVRKLICHDLEMDLEARSVLRGNVSIQLSPTLWKLLEALLRVSPKVVDRAELEGVLWGEDVPESNSLKVHMHHLRKRVDGSFDEKLIHTVSRHGFAMYKEKQG